MCRILQVYVASLYAHLQRPEPWRAVMDDVLMAQVRIAFTTSDGKLGTPRSARESQS
jgi:hypothetical protein